jgi:hypothetical protein
LKFALVLALRHILVQAWTLAPSWSLVRPNALLADWALIHGVVLALTEAPFLAGVGLVVFELTHVLLGVVALAILHLVVAALDVCETRIEIVRVL